MDNEPERSQHLRLPDLVPALQRAPVLRHGRAASQGLGRLRRANDERSQTVRTVLQVSRIPRLIRGDNFVFQQVLLQSQSGEACLRHGVQEEDHVRLAFGTVARSQEPVSVDRVQDRFDVHHVEGVVLQHHFCVVSVVY